MESQPKTNISYGISKFKSINGITCYMNSILHIFQQIPIFADYIFTRQFVNILEEKHKNNKDEIENTVIFELFKLFKTSMTNDDATITPTSFKRTIGKKNDMWNEYRHQDSQEFVNFLIQTLMEEIGIKVDFIPGDPMKLQNLLTENIDSNNHISNLSLQAGIDWRDFQSKEFSPLKEMFDSMTCESAKCSCCSSVSNRMIPFNMLQIQIPSENNSKEFSIEELLDNYYKEEQIDKNNSSECDLCGFRNSKIKKDTLWKTAKVLIIHFKRFEYNIMGQISKKKTNNITYPIYDLDMSKYFNDESPHKNNSKYNLLGINLHVGFGMFGNNSGHYTSLVKNRYDNNWYLFNDEHKLVKKTKREDLQDESAYVLFYYRND